MCSASLPLDSRNAHPDPRRILRAAFPRAAWQAHGNFGGQVAFWLDRHLALVPVILRHGPDHFG